MIIGLVGLNRVGKDTVAEIFQEYAKADNIEFKSFAFAKPIKDVAKLLFGWTDEQVNGDLKDSIDIDYAIKPRDFFQKFGTEIMQYDIYKYLPSLEVAIPKRCFWSQLIMKQIKDSNTQHAIITDVRFQHEVETIRNQSSHKHILIKIEKYDNKSVYTSAHISQIELANQQFDYCIDNSIRDMQTLRKNVKIVYDDIKIKYLV